MKTKKPKLTQRKFAKDLGISAQVLSYHLRNNPECPELGDRESWTAFLVVNGREAGVPPALRTKLAEARLGLAEEHKLRLMHERKIREGELKPVAEFDTNIKQLFAAMTGELERVFCHELPPVLEGLRAADIATKNKQELGFLWQRFKQQFRVLAQLPEKI
jgi:hypothetical protein